MRQFVRLTRGHNEGDSPPEPVRDDTSLGAIAPTRAPQRLTCISLSLSKIDRRRSPDLPCNWG
jgi:hypothetical protein